MLQTGQPDLVNWVYGPGLADVGPAAQIQVPQGFRFANAADAAILLRAGGNPTPATLAGLLMPTSSGYMVVFEYTPIGYVKTGDREKVDSESALSALQNSLREQRNTATLEWAKAPIFDGSRRSLEWAVAVTTGQRKSVNHTLRLLGREGVLDAIAIHNSGSAAAIPLKQLLAGVTFKPGFAYNDYRKGDRVSQHRLSDLAASEAPAPYTARLSYLWPSIGGGTAVLIGCSALIVARRRHRTRRVRSGPGPVRILLNAAASRRLEYSYPGHTNGSHNGSANGNGSTNGNGHSNGTNGNGKLRRRRTFDYQRFYSDLMSEVSDRSQVSPAIPARRVATAPIATVNKAEPELNSAVANLGLIDHQKRLIEEQQRLIREQAKLIEEKTRLIQEKNQVLDKQAELFGNIF